MEATFLNKQISKAGHGSSAYQFSPDHILFLFVYSSEPNHQFMFIVGSSSGRQVKCL